LHDERGDEVALDLLDRHVGQKCPQGVQRVVGERQDERGTAPAMEPTIGTKATSPEKVARKSAPGTLLR
jgi:hypothetical protein